MKNMLLTILTVGLLAGPMAANASVIWSTNGHEYEVVFSEGITWTNAYATAQASGWYLATIGSAGENSFIESLLGTSFAERSHFWIGGTDQAVEGTFQWIDGTPFLYTDFWGGEPNNLNNEDFLAMDLRSGNWAWNDAPDNLGSLYSYARGYLMERSVPEPGTLTLLGLGLLGLGFIRRRKNA